MMVHYSRKQHDEDNALRERLLLRANNIFVMEKSSFFDDVVAVLHRNPFVNDAANECCDHNEEGITFGDNES